MAVSKEAIRDLHAWTHGCLDLLVEHLAAMPGDLFVRDVPGFGRGSIRDQLVHICRAEAVWVCALQNRPTPDLRSDQFPTVDSIAGLRGRVKVETLRYLNLLDEERLNQELDEYPEYWSSPHRSPAFILLHVLTHAFHHKGQIVAMCRILGHPAPDTDLQRQ